MLSWWKSGVIHVSHCQFAITGPRSLLLLSHDPCCKKLLWLHISLLSLGPNQLSLSRQKKAKQSIVHVVSSIIPNKLSQQKNQQNSKVSTADIFGGTMTDFFLTFLESFQFKLIFPDYCLNQSCMYIKHF